MSEDEKPTKDEAIDYARLFMQDYQCQYAPQECDADRVAQARSRWQAKGGTLAYMADVFECDEESAAAVTCPIHNAPLRPQGPMVNVVACPAPGCTLFAFVVPGAYR